MNVVVVGCGRLGSELAYRLFQKGHQVTVVDNASAAFQALPPDFRGRTVEGEVLNQEVLHRAGVERATAVAVVTNNDAVNAVVGRLASAHYHVPNVVVRNYDPRRRTVHEAFGLQVISSASWGAQRMEELLYQSEFTTVFSAGNGEVEVYEFAVPPAWAGHALAELLPPAPAGSPQECVLVALTRAGRASLPGSDARLQEGDVLHISATLERIEVLRQRIRSAPEPQRPSAGSAQVAAGAPAGEAAPAGSQDAPPAAAGEG